jgi:hypothetical protein
MSFQRIFCIFFLMIVGCTAGGVTQLAGGFHSYQSVSEVRAAINRSGDASKWKEERTDSPRSDSRPNYSFLAMTGPFRILGINGSFRLIFYKDRLMSTEFSTSQGHELISALRDKGTTIPPAPRQEIRLDHHTLFR